MNSMNEHAQYSLALDRQQGWRDEAARDHALREVRRGRPGLCQRLGCQVLLGLAGSLLKLAARMQELAAPGSPGADWQPPPAPLPLVSGPSNIIL